MSSTFIKLTPCSSSSHRQRDITQHLARDKRDIGDVSAVHTDLINMELHVSFIISILKTSYFFKKKKLKEHVRLNVINIYYTLGVQ